MSQPEKKPLSRERLIEAGLQLADACGMDQVSVRRIAAALGVTPMAIYRHVPDWESLQAAMLDRFIQRAAVLPVQPLPWQDWMRHVARRMHQALTGSPGWIALFGRIRLERSALQVLDAGVAVLRAEGFSPRLAVQAQLAMLQCVIGAASLSQSFQRHLGGAVPVAAGLDSGDFPHVAECWQLMGEAAVGDRLGPSLEWLIAGLSQDAGV